MWPAWISAILEWVREWRADRARRAKDSLDRRAAWEAKEDARRDADAAHYRLNMEHAAEAQRRVIDELVERLERQERRIDSLEESKTSMLKEMMNQRVARAKCEARTEAQDREIEGQKRQIESLGLEIQALKASRQ